MAKLQWRFAGFKLNAARRELTAADGTQVELTPLAFDILLWLLRYHDQSWSASDLSRLLAPTRRWSQGSVVNAIALLRRRLSAHDPDPVIEFERGAGYRLAVPLEATPAAPPTGSEIGRALSANVAWAAGTIALMPEMPHPHDAARAWPLWEALSKLSFEMTQHWPIELVPLARLLRVLAVQDLGSDVLKRAQALGRQFGVSSVLWLRLLHDVDAWRLEYRLIELSGRIPEQTGQLRAADASDLGTELGAAIIAPHRYMRHRRPVSSDDTWIQSVYAMVRRARQSHHWQRAHRLLSALAEVSPAHCGLRVEAMHARNMHAEDQARFDDALQGWIEMETAARSLGKQDWVRCARRHAALCAAMCGLCDEALRLAGPDPNDLMLDETSPAGLEQRAVACFLHLMVGRLPSNLLAETPDPASITDEPRARGHAWCIRAHRALARFAYAEAVRAFEQSIADYRAAGARGHATALAMGLIHALIRADRLERAEQLLTQVESECAGLGMVRSGLPWLRARILRRRNKGALLRGVLMPSLQTGQSDLGHAAASVLVAQWLAEQGQCEDAQRLINAVAPIYMQHPKIRDTVWRVHRALAEREAERVPLALH